MEPLHYPCAAWAFDKILNPEILSLRRWAVRNRALCGLFATETMDAIRCAPLAELLRFYALGFRIEDGRASACVPG